jgi:hypothetical protein
MAKNHGFAGASWGKMDASCAGCRGPKNGGERAQSPAAWVNLKVEDMNKLWDFDGF